MHIICDAPGQTCNRLWSYVATLSDCIVNKRKMVILFYDYTIEQFPNLRQSKYIYFPLYHPWYLNRGNGWNNFKGATWKLTHSRKWDKIFSFLGFKKGWWTRDDTKNIEKAYPELTKIFLPADYICEKAEKEISCIRKTSDIVIGVHIRRGDYKTWNNGKFFYSHEEYKDILIRLSNSFEGKRVAFFISSNEPIPVETFKELNCHWHKDSSAILDLHTLSLCDYIIGPYSTFSRWASFIANKPICWIDKSDISTFEFSPMTSYFYQANGNKLKDW